MKGTVNMLVKIAENVWVDPLWVASIYLSGQSETVVRFKDGDYQIISSSDVVDYATSRLNDAVMA